MEIAAVVRSGSGRHDVTVRTDASVQDLAVAAKRTGAGFAVNGGEFLVLAIATCYCNDLYREATRMGIALDSVEVEARAVFDGVGVAARDIRYRARIDSPAPPEDVERLLRETDAVAEVHNTVRRGTPVTLETSSRAAYGAGSAASRRGAMSSVTAEQLARLRDILEHYPMPPLCGPEWRERATDDDVWIRVVSQVVVVGRASPAELLHRPDIRERLSWAKLSQAPDDAARQIIWQVLRDIAARYAGKQPEKCPKTAALLKNLRALKLNHTGFRGGLLA
jgi:uncharacterized OsmC-like protein